MSAVAAIVAVLICIACPPAGPLAIVLVANLHLFGHRARMRRTERARQALARAKAEEKRERDRIAAWKAA